MQQLCKDKKKNASTVDKTGDLGAELSHKATVEENDTVQDFLQLKPKKKNAESLLAKVFGKFLHRESRINRIKYSHMHLIIIKRGNVQLISRRSISRGKYKKAIKSFWHCIRGIRMEKPARLL